MQRKRTQGRELALQLLYQIDLLKGLPEPERQRFLTEHAEGADQRAFGEGMVKGVLERQAEIDAEIEEVAKNWDLGRMAIIDRNILRMGAWELRYRGAEIPPKVAINEAVELAKKYSTKNSSGFVNGILDRIRERFVEAQEKAGGATPAAADAAPAQAASAGPAEEPPGS